jgi:ubiquinol-cytochrome c reductase cytochrome b subunit
VRTAFGTATISFYVVLFFGGASDVLAATFGLSVNAIIWTFRGLAIVLPPLVWFLTYRLCKDLCARDGVPAASTVRLREIPHRLRRGTEPPAEAPEPAESTT